MFSVLIYSLTYFDIDNKKKALGKCSASENSHMEPDGLTDKVHSDNIKCLTLSSLASISTTSVSTSSIFALKNKSKRMNLYHCMTEINSIKVIYLVGKQTALQSACNFTRSQKACCRSINLWVTDGALWSQTPDMFEQRQARGLVALKWLSEEPSWEQFSSVQTKWHDPTQWGEHGSLVHPKTPIHLLAVNTTTTNTTHNCIWSHWERCDLHPAAWCSP